MIGVIKVILKVYLVKVQVLSMYIEDKNGRRMGLRLVLFKKTIKIKQIITKIRKQWQSGKFQ